MKFIIALALWVCALELTVGEKRMAGYARGRRIFGRTLQGIPAVCTAASNDQSFCNDTDECLGTSVLTCLGEGNGYEIPCPPEKKYCIASTDGKAQCSEKVAAGCPASPPSFKCTGVGYYPDPSNCRVYYYCSKNPTTGVTTPEALFCPTGYVFDPNSASKMYCLYTSTASRCVTASGCAGATSTKNIAMNYLSNAQFVAVCLPGGLEPLIYQCPTGTKAVLENIPVTCSYTCKAQGLFENSLDKFSYYDCKYDASKKLFSELKTCPTGTVFSKTTCVPN